MYLASLPHCCKEQVLKVLHAVGKCTQLQLMVCTMVQERKLFDEKFIRLDTRRLCELTSAADALDMKPLVDLTSRALARMIEGKSAEEIRCFASKAHATCLCVCLTQTCLAGFLANTCYVSACCARGKTQHAGSPSMLQVQGHALSCLAGFETCSRMLSPVVTCPLVLVLICRLISIPHLACAC